LSISVEFVPLLSPQKKIETEAIEQSIVVNDMGRDLPVASPEYFIILKLKAGGTDGYELPSSFTDDLVDFYFEDLCNLVLLLNVLFAFFNII